MQIFFVYYSRAKRILHLCVESSKVKASDNEGNEFMRKHVKGNVSWVGYLDWELETFHGDDYSIFHGSSKNAYLIEEEKTILVDTVWTPHHYDFIQNLKS